MAKALFSSLALLLPLIVLFVMCALYAVLLRRDYVAEQDWPEVACTLGAGVIENTECEKRFRVVFPVETLDDEQPATSLNATKGADPHLCPFTSRSDAEKFLSSIHPSDSPCYLSPDGTLVRLTPGGATTTEIEYLQVRALLPLVAAVATGLLILVVLSYFLFANCTRWRTRRRTRRRTPATPNPRLDVHNGARVLVLSSQLAPLPAVLRPSPVSTRSASGFRRPLSSHDARLLLSSLRHHATALPEDDTCCPICLDDFADALPAGKDLVTLPCTHVYHETCALQWFRKGSCSCPCCNLDLMPHVRSARREDARIRADADAAESTVSSASTTTSNSTNTTGAEEPAGSESLAQYPWAWAWWSRETSSENHEHRARTS